MRFVQTLAALVVVLYAGASMAAELKFDAGTRELGGTVSFEHQMILPEDGDRISGTVFTLAPTFGYFVVDNLEVGGYVEFLTYTGSLYRNTSGRGSIGVFVDYFIPAEMSMVPHAGLAAGVLSTLGSSEGSTQILNLSIPLAILIPLNEHVGIDVGMKINFMMDISNRRNDKFLALPFGLGIRSFF